MVRILNHGKQMFKQLYHCCSFLSSQDLCVMYKSWIHPTLEHGNALYSEAVLSHMQYLNNLQTQIECTCSSASQSLRMSITIILQSLYWFAISLLGSNEGIYNYCTVFQGTDGYHWSICLHA